MNKWTKKINSWRIPVMNRTQINGRAEVDHLDYKSKVNANCRREFEVISTSSLNYAKILKYIEHMKSICHRVCQTNWNRWKTKASSLSTTCVSSNEWNRVSKFLEQFHRWSPLLIQYEAFQKNLIEKERKRDKEEKRKRKKKTNCCCSQIAFSIAMSCGSSVGKRDVEQMTDSTWNWYGLVLNGLFHYYCSNKSKIVHLFFCWNSFLPMFSANELNFLWFEMGNWAATTFATVASLTGCVVNGGVVGV